MAGIFAFKCRCCGEVHEGSPSFAFTFPDHYARLSDEQKATMGHCTSDLCTIANDGHTDFFIRAVLEVPIHGVADPFMWGLWVSLSERSFQRYVDTYDTPVEGEGFFGWVCNTVPWYPKVEHLLAADVFVQAGGKRPLLRLHAKGDDEHPLVIDQQQGISIAKAQEIAESLTHPA